MRLYDRDRNCELVGDNDRCRRSREIGEMWSPAGLSAHLCDLLQLDDRQMLAPAQVGSGQAVGVRILPARQVSCGTNLMIDSKDRSPREPPTLSHESMGRHDTEAPAVRAV